MIAAPTKSHVVRFIEAEANGCERLDFFVFRFSLFLCFAITICLGWSFIVRTKNAI